MRLGLLLTMLVIMSGSSEASAQAVEEKTTKEKLREVLTATPKPEGKCTLDLDYDFNAMDQNKDGRVLLQEFIDMPYMGERTPGLDGFRKQMFAGMDLNADGEVMKVELAMYYEMKMPQCKWE